MSGFLHAICRFTVIFVLTGFCSGLRLCTFITYLLSLLCRNILFVAPQFAAELEEMKAAWTEGGTEGCKHLLEEKADEWKKVPIKVAVTGNSGVGKSSFINAIRGLTADDVELGAAAVGVNETTLEPRSYQHPDNPMLEFWDLPGVGTNEFPKATYLPKIGVDRYDFFLLMTADRFTENDTWLGKEIRGRNKKYFFVRTKIGVDISNDRQSHPRTHNEEAVIERIRRSTEDQLKKNGCEDVPVFLIDNYQLNKFEFEKLKQQIIQDFPELKRSALIFSLQSTSEEMVKVKVAELRSRRWKCAALSAGVAAVPVPGLSVGVDLGIIIHEAIFYVKQLGIDSTSLQRCARLHSVDHVKLQSVVTRALGYRVAGTVTSETMRLIVLSILGRSIPIVAATAVEEGARAFMPLIGSLIAAPLSFGGTYLALKLILDKFEMLALEVMKIVAGDVGMAAEIDGENATGEVGETVVAAQLD